MSGTRGDDPIRVVVVDDSTFIRKALGRMLGEHPQITLAGNAGSGEELLAHLETWRPDVVILDIDMPGMGGLAALDRIAPRTDIAVIIMSTHTGEGAPMTIEALHRGATDFIDKQRYSLVDFAALRAVLLTKIFHVAGIEELPPALPPETIPDESATDLPMLTAADLEQEGTSDFDLVVVGASTGGPPTLQTLLEDLGARLAIPILIVQHMPVGFTHAFAERLNAHLPLIVREVQPGERLRPGVVYIAPSGLHVRIRRTRDGLCAELSTHPSDATHRPSIDILFRSAARSVGDRLVGMLLTGMGSDGAQGLLTIRKQGGHTLAQDEASCVVYGMPRAAAAIGAVAEMTPLSNLGHRLRALLDRRS